MPAAARLPDLFAPDRSLLARFADAADGDAFAALVRRHGPMVLGVCRRAVADAHHAEDAFQAVWLVLARNPAAALGTGSVGGWLHGVARRVGLAARRRDRRRERREVVVARPASISPQAPDDTFAVLDAELAALPADDRAALVSHYLREQPQADAAAELGWSLSTFRRRLAAAKDRLRARLVRRGVTLAAAGGACVPVSAALAARVAELVRPGAFVPPAVAALAGRRPPVGLGFAAASLVGVLGWVTLGAAAQEPPQPPPAPAAVAPAWATVRGAVVFPAECPVPAARPIAIKDRQPPLPDCCTGRSVFDELVQIDPKTRGIRNVVVWLRPDSTDKKEPFPRDRVHPALRDPPPRDHLVTLDACQFRPRVVVARGGDAIRFRNDMAGVSNVRFASGPAFEGFFNRVLVAKSDPTPAIRLAAGATPAGRFRSDLYPWMAGAVWAFDHPYAAVTDAAGRFELKDVPAGTWRLALWHEAGGYPAGTRGLGRVVRVGGDTDLGRLQFESGDWTPAE